MKICGQEAPLGIRLGEMEHDRGGLCEDETAIDQRRDLSRGIDGEEFRTSVPARLQSHGNGLELHAELLEHPAARIERVGANS